MMHLTDGQWAAVQPLIAPALGDPGEGRAKGGRARADPRECMGAALWILATDLPWRELPRSYPPYQTCHHYFSVWSLEGRIDSILFVLAEHLFQETGIDILADNDDDSPFRQASLSSRDAWISRTVNLLTKPAVRSRILSQPR